MSETMDTIEMNPPATDSAYCVFCRSGSEQKAAREINERFPGLHAIAPVRIVREKHGSAWIDREIPILPGYLFLFADRDLPGGLCSKVHSLFRILGCDETCRRLHGDDLLYATWMNTHHGRIGPSRILLAENQKARIIDGPLADIQGTIKKLDRHKRRAILEFPFAGQLRTVSVSVEFLTSEDDLSTESAS